MIRDKTAEDLYADPQAEPEKDGTETFLDRPQRTNDPKSLKDKQVSDKVKALNEENDLLFVLSTQEGQRLMARLLAFCNWDRTPWHPSHSEKDLILGRRQVAEKIIEWCKDTDFELWVQVERILEKSRAKPKTSESRGR